MNTNYELCHRVGLNLVAAIDMYNRRGVFHQCIRVVGYVL